MAKWITKAQAAELEKDSNDMWKVPEPAVNNHRGCIFKWKPMTLAILFGSQKQPPSWLSPVDFDAESALMQALAEVEEDEQLDDGEIKIPSDEEYDGWYR